MEKKDMNFEHEINLVDGIITIHKHDETFFDIKLSSYWRWVLENDLNFNDNNSFKAYNLNTEEYFGLNDYHTIKENLKTFILDSKFKNY
jgi:hypothetical protein